MSDTVDIPTNWIKTTIGEVVAATIDQSGPSGSEFLYIDISSIDNHLKRIVAQKTVSVQDAPSRARQRIQPGDVLVSMTRPKLNAVALVPGSITDAVASTGFCVLRPISVRPALIAYLVQSSNFVNAMSGLVQGALYPAVRPKDILSYAFGMPPLDEQDRILSAIEKKISNIEAGIVALDRVLANLKRYRATVLKAACEGRLVPTEAAIARKEGREYEPAKVLLQRILGERRKRWEADQLAKMKAKGQKPRDDRWMAKYEDAMKLDKGALPEGWVWATVEMVGDVLLGRQRAPQYLTGQWSHSYLRVANIKDNRIDFGDVEMMDFDPDHFAKYCLEPGDILVSEGQSPDRVGESAIYAGGIDGLCFQKTLHRFRPVRSGPSSKFAQIVFRAHVKQGVFRKMASITTNIAHLTLEKFQGAPFPLPPLAEQHRIVAEVDRLLSVADTTEQTTRAQLARAKRLRQAVLKRAFEGKLVPQEASQPASAQVAQFKQPKSERRPASPTPALHLVPPQAPSFGEVLREFRTSQRLSPQAFASRFEIEVELVAKLESIAVPFELDQVVATRKTVRAALPALGVAETKLILDELAATLRRPVTEEYQITLQAARKAP